MVCFCLVCCLWQHQYKCFELKETNSLFEELAVWRYIALVYELRVYPIKHGGCMEYINIFFVEQRGMADIVYIISNAISSLERKRNTHTSTTTTTTEKKLFDNIVYIILYLSQRFENVSVGYLSFVSFATFDTLSEENWNSIKIELLPRKYIYFSNAIRCEVRSWKLKVES